MFAEILPAGVADTPRGASAALARPYRL